MALARCRRLLVVIWALWSRRTGVAVDLQASDWALALRRIKYGEAQVIDTVFETAERQRFLDFSPPYADIPVSIFAHTSIGGLSDIDTLRGFVVGAKTGDGHQSQDRYYDDDHHHKHHKKHKKHKKHRWHDDD